MRGFRFILCSLLCLLVTSAQAQTHGSIHPDPAAAGSLPPLRLDALSPGASVLHADPIRGVPRLLFASGASPSPRGTASAEEAAWSHLREHARLYRLEGALPFLEVRAVHDAAFGPLIVAFRAKVNGVPLFRDELRIAMARDRSLLGISGSLSPQLVSTSQNPPSFRLTAEAAIAHAMAKFDGAAPASADLVALDVDEAGHQRYRLPDRDTALRSAKVLFDRGGALLPAYYVEVVEQARAFAFVVDARNGDILLHNDLVAHHGYRVWVSEDGAPHPSPLGRSDFPFRSSRQPIYASAVLETRDHGPISTSDPWLPPGANRTSGNNVEAYFGERTKIYGTPTSPDVFDYVFDFGKRPSEDNHQRRSSITQAFYTSNWLHDLLYDVGFDENWGNAQQSNFGRGGAGADRLLVSTQDDTARGNAYMMTPADGSPPQMSLGLARFGTSDRDVAHDATVVAHEFGHFVTNRLIGNGNGLTRLQGRAMGEGWSDLLGLLVAVDPQDRFVEDNDAFQGRYLIGSYAFGAPYGTRRYPYSTSHSVNPLTFGHVTSAKALPSNVPSKRNNLPNYQVHNAGEVWASMLWNVYTSFLNDPSLGFDEARAQMLHLWIAGLKLTPIEPTFIEARDALLLAALGFDEPVYDRALSAFANRGAGIGAVAPHVLSRGDRPARESFDGSPDLHVQEVRVEESPWNCDRDGVVDAGETGTLTVILANGDHRPASDVVVRVSTSTPGVHFLEEDEQELAELAPLGASSHSFHFRLEDTHDLVSIAFDVSVSDRDQNTDQASIEVVANYDRWALLPALHSHSFACHDPAWTTVSTSAERCIRLPEIQWQCPLPAAGEELHFVSPVQTAGSRAFSISFFHSFDFGSEAGPHQSGGVIEISKDGGDTWSDIGVHTTPGYNGEIHPAANSPLAGRPAFVGKLPGRNPVTIDLGLDHRLEDIILRFRLVSSVDTPVSRPGWTLSSLQFLGLGSEPPCVVQVDRRDCKNQPPVVRALVPPAVESGRTVILDASGSYDPEGDPLEFLWSGGRYWSDDSRYVQAFQVADEEAAVTSFQAPLVNADTFASITLAVSDGRSIRTTELDMTIVPLSYDITAHATSTSQTVESGKTGTLVGEAEAPEESVLRYQWTQIGGFPAAIESPKSATTTFTAPVVSKELPLRFALQVSDGLVESPLAFVDVIVRPAGSDGSHFALPPTSFAAAPRPSKKRVSSGCSAGGDASTQGWQWASLFIAAAVLRARRARAARP